MFCGFVVWVGVPRAVYVYESGVCFADSFPWVVGRGVWSGVWMLVGLPSDVGGVVAGCREAVESGAVYVVKLVTARGAGNQQ